MFLDDDYSYIWTYSGIHNQCITNDFTYIRFHDANVFTYQIYRQSKLSRSLLIFLNIYLIFDRIFILTFK